jgi:hypothetical protein
MRRRSIGVIAARVESSEQVDTRNTNRQFVVLNESKYFGAL